MTSRNTSLEIDVLARRLDHLLRVEWYGAPGGLAFKLWDPKLEVKRSAYLMAATPRRLVELGAEALPELESVVQSLGGEVPDELRGDMGEQETAPANAGRSWNVFSETILPRTAPKARRIRQWIRRVLYLSREECFEGELARGLLYSCAVHRIVAQTRPFSLPFLLEAHMDAVDDRDRATLVFLMRHRYAGRVEVEETDASVIEKMHAVMVQQPWHLMHVSPALVERFVSAGVLPAGFTPPTWESSGDASRSPNRSGD